MSDVVVIAHGAERIAAALGATVGTNRRATIGAPCRGRLGAGHTDVTVTRYELDLRLDYNPCVGTAPIPKRNLRVTKWLGTIPAVGVCTFCDRLFYVPLTALKKVADAQESLRVQFTEHKCKTQTDS
jgi:hypothetical protein